MKRGIGIRGLLTQVSENAVDATWDGASSGSHLAEPLKANSIARFETPIPEIPTVVQPENSFFGRQEETRENRILRISERLRHKNRAINAKDYEELVLDKFDIVFKVQCFMAYNDIKDKVSAPDPHTPPRSCPDCGSAKRFGPAGKG